uniref:Zgc:194578 n=1 Tax=Neogobius melanostomus TaxID=47308 RepID=A0A8C6TVN0_9GOBI
MTSSMLRRQLKNLVQNYSEAEVKVREATSNDPWGPSSTQMADISDLTYNAVACNEIMTMLWKRLKDDRNWRHIHKSLTLLECLLKTGDERVLLKMKDNVYIVKALTEYRFVEKDGKDNGVNVREKAKVVLVLMEDDDKLKEEREFAFKTREKTSKGAAASSTDEIKDPNYKPVFVAGSSGLPSLANIPSVADLAASFEKKKEERLKQEAEKKDQLRRAKMTEDELQWEDAGKGGEAPVEAWGGQKSEEETDAWGAPVKPKEAESPWGTPDRPETTDTAAEGADGWGAQKNGEDPFEESADPFCAAEEVEFTEEDGADPFQAPKDKSPDGKPQAFTPTEDSFAAKKDDPFSAPKDDPFSAPKSDPFTSDKEDPFSAPKDYPFKTQAGDPFGAPKDDPFNTPKDDPFTSAKSEDPFGAPKDDPFKTPKDDAFKAQAEDPFGAPKDDPFTSAKSDPFDAPQEDPFGMAKNDPFISAKDEPKSPPRRSTRFRHRPNRERIRSAAPQVRPEETRLERRPHHPKTTPLAQPLQMLPHSLPPHLLQKRTPSLHRPNRQTTLSPPRLHLL